MWTYLTTLVDVKLRDEKGQTSVEYALVIVLVALALALLLALGISSGLFSSFFTKIGNALNGDTTP